MKRWKRVPFETDEPVGIGPLIKIFGDPSRVVATVTRYEWYESDGHENTGYVTVQTSKPRPAGNVIAHHKELSASIALESDDLWDPAWGRLPSRPPPTSV